MSAVITGHMSISLDGYVAGPSQSAEDPLGRGGMELHKWLFAGEAADYIDTANASAAAFIMGRHMFGPGRGVWDMSWEGWWGGNPFTGPVFVLTHYERDSLTVNDGAPFHFVTCKHNSRRGSHEHIGQLVQRRAKSQPTASGCWRQNQVEFRVASRSRMLMAQVL